MLYRINTLHGMALNIEIKYEQFVDRFEMHRSFNILDGS